MTQDSVTLHGHYDENGLVVLTSPHARHPIRCRPNTSDLSVFRQVFIEREYRCLDEVSEAGLVVDCGANAGYSAAYFLTRFPNCSLIAVEPDPDNAHLLRLNLAPYGNAVRIIESAVWSHPARLTLADTEYRDGGAWARQVRECGPEEPTSFTAIDINQLLAESGHERIAILKMDIEGAEAVVFSANLHPWLDRVDNLVVELHDDSMFGNASTIFHRAIVGQGFAVSRSGELTVCKRRANEETMNETGRTADQWNAIGVGHAQQGNMSEACTSFQRAAEIDPNSAPFHYNLGIARQNLGYIEEAEASYRRALELKPDHVNALTNLGTILVAQMQLDEAVACCRLALEWTPNDAEIHNNLGAALFEQGKAEEATACYRRALALKPDYPEANNNLGVALHRQGKFDEAIACYRQVLALNPDYGDAHDNLGAALFEQGDIDARE